MAMDPILDAWLVESTPTDGDAAPLSTADPKPSGTSSPKPFETRLLTTQGPDAGDGFRVDPASLTAPANTARSFAGGLRGAVTTMVAESTDSEPALPDWQTPGVIATLGNEWFTSLERLAADFEAFATGLDDAAKGYASAENVNTTSMQGG